MSDPCVYVVFWAPTTGLPGRPLAQTLWLLGSKEVEWPMILGFFGFPKKV